MDEGRRGRGEEGKWEGGGRRGRRGGKGRKGRGREGGREGEGGCGGMIVFPKPYIWVYSVYCSQGQTDAETTTFSSPHTTSPRPHLPPSLWTVTSPFLVLPLPGPAIYGWLDLDQCSTHPPSLASVSGEMGAGGRRSDMLSTDSCQSSPIPFTDPKRKFKCSGNSVSQDS